MAVFFLCSVLALCIFPRASKALEEAPPPPPCACTAQAGTNGDVTVSWDAPRGDATVTGYKVYFSLDNAFPGSRSGQWILARADDRQAVLAQELTKGAAYFFFVSALGVSSESEPAPAQAPATPVSLPGAPQADVLLNENGAVMLNWLSPLDVGGTPVIRYELTVDPPVEGSPFTLSGNTLSHTLTDLDPTVCYTFSLTAVNAAGTGPALVQSASPIRLRISARATSNVAGSVTVKWGLKSESGELPEILSYTVEYCREGSGEGWVQEDGGLSGIYEINGLQDEQVYRIRVRAFTADNTVLLSKTIQEVPENPTEHIDCALRSQGVPQGTIVRFTADNTAIREGMPDGAYYVPTSWKTNPEGSWELQDVGDAYQASFSTSKIALGSRPLTVTYTEYTYTQAGGWGEPTGKTLTRSITYTIDQASQEVPATGDEARPLTYLALALLLAAALAASLRLGRRLREE